MMLSLFKAKAIIPYQSRRQRTDLGYPQRREYWQTFWLACWGQTPLPDKQYKKDAKIYACLAKK